jgi:hypothetical protein
MPLKSLIANKAEPQHWIPLLWQPLLEYVYTLIKAKSY